MSFSNRRVHTHMHAHTAKGKVLTAEITSGYQILFLAALLLFSINSESDDFIPEYPTEHLNVKDVCFFCRTVTLRTRFYLFSEVDDDVRGSGQSFFLIGPQSRKRTWRQEKQKSISAFNKSEFLLRVSVRSRLTAGTPPGVGDLSKFERSSSELGVGLKKKRRKHDNTWKTQFKLFLIQHLLTTVKLLCIVKARNTGRPPMTTAKITPWKWTFSSPESAFYAPHSKQ